MGKTKGIVKKAVVKKTTQCSKNKLKGDLAKGKLKTSGNIRITRKRSQEKPVDMEQPLPKQTKFNKSNKTSKPNKGTESKRGNSMSQNSTTAAAGEVNDNYPSINNNATMTGARDNEPVILGTTSSLIRSIKAKKGNEVSQASKANLSKANHNGRNLNNTGGKSPTPGTSAQERSKVWWCTSCEKGTS